MGRFIDRRRAIRSAKRTAKDLPASSFLDKRRNVKYYKRTTRYNYLKWYGGYEYPGVDKRMGRRDRAKRFDNAQDLYRNKRKPTSDHPVRTGGRQSAPKKRRTNGTFTPTPVVDAQRAANAANKRCACDADLTGGQGPAKRAKGDYQRWKCIKWQGFKSSTPARKCLKYDDEPGNTFRNVSDPAPVVNDIVSYIGGNLRDTFRFSIPTASAPASVGVASAPAAPRAPWVKTGLRLNKFGEPIGTISNAQLKASGLA